VRPQANDSHSALLHPQQRRFDALPVINDAPTARKFHEWNLSPLPPVCESPAAYGQPFEQFRLAQKTRLEPLRFRRFLLDCLRCLHVSLY